MSVSAPHRAFRLGVTGSIAAGKSTVMSILRELGADTIDADRVYHELIAPGMPLNQCLVDRWGDGIRNDDGSINRRALGAIVFADPAQLRQLDELTHPVIRAAIDQRLDRSTARVAAFDAVKLVESGHADTCDAVWVVTARPETQRQRLMEDRGLSADDAAARIAAQGPMGPKLARADVVIPNDGTAEELRDAVLAAWKTIPVLHAPDQR